MGLEVHHQCVQLHGGAAARTVGLMHCTALHCTALHCTALLASPEHHVCVILESQVNQDSDPNQPWNLKYRYTGYMNTTRWAPARDNATKGGV